MSQCNHYKSSAILSERWFNAGGLCLRLADPARSSAQLRLSPRIAIIARFATATAVRAHYFKDLNAIIINRAQSQNCLVPRQPLALLVKGSE